VYIVQDVSSRACLAIRAVRNLSQHAARDVLCEGVKRLRRLGINEPVVIQSDGGSDFTSELFQRYCATIGQWIRCKVNQKGGMGILERLNRTFKYCFLFREDCSTFDELRDLCGRFEQWYNRERKHSSLAFRTPWQVLVGHHSNPTGVTSGQLAAGPQDQDSSLSYPFVENNAADDTRNSSCCFAKHSVRNGVNASEPFQGSFFT
jgi:hypothetical protein